MTRKATRLLSMRWFLLEEPWAHSSDAGTLIQAGSCDPHGAVPICDTTDFFRDNYSVETARELAKHIVDLHNATLVTNRGVTK